MSRSGTVPRVLVPSRNTAEFGLISAGLAVLGGVAYLAATRVPTPSYWLVGGTLVTLPMLAYAAFSRRVEVSLVGLLLYLGLLDGFLRLKTGQQSLTLLRDLFLYAIVAGCLARLMLARQRITLPALSGWVIAFSAIVLVQLANPRSVGLEHTVAALRPHLEWVPLFFLGYAVMRDKSRIRVFLLLVVVVAAANGIVSLIQSNLTPEQLGGWGPGYQARVFGTGDVSGRTFTADSGETLIRPMGLGSDSGVGGLFGLIAVAPAIALIGQARKRVAGRAALLLAWGPVFAIVTSQGRTVLVASLLAVLVYVGFTTVAQRMIASLAAVLLAGVVVFGAVSVLANNAGEGSFDRYKTITPGNLLGSVESDRGTSLGRIPSLAVDYPFGGGLGVVGPAGRFAGGGAGGLDGETQVTFLISELGALGVLTLCGLHLLLVFKAGRRVRRIADNELRVMLAAVAATLAALVATWLSTASTATSPTAPFFWFSAGVLAWWMFGAVKSEKAEKRERLTRIAEAP